MQVANSDQTRVIVTSDYPEVYLTPIEQDRLRGAISKEIDALPRDGRAVRFDDILRAGAIVVQSANIWLRDWLAKKASGFRLKRGLEVKIQGLKVLQRIHRTTDLIPGTPEDPAAVLRLLEFQNPTLKANNNAVRNPGQSGLSRFWCLESLRDSSESPLG